MSTLKINRLEPLSGNTITAIGLTIQSASYAATASYVAGASPLLVDDNGKVTEYGKFAVGYYASNPYLIEFDAPQIATIPPNRFEACSSLIRCDMPNLIQLPSNMFSSCTSLVSVSHANAVTSSGALYGGCTSLRYLYLPKLSDIGNNIFGNTIPGLSGSLTINSNATSSSPWGSIEARVLSQGWTITYVNG